MTNFKNRRWCDFCQKENNNSSNVADVTIITEQLQIETLIRDNAGKESIDVEDREVKHLRQICEDCQVEIDAKKAYWKRVNNTPAVAVLDSLDDYLAALGVTQT